MADMVPMGTEGKVALESELQRAIARVRQFQSSANGIITQVKGVVDGLHSEYSGEGADQFYIACDKNIEQLTNMLKNICEAYAGDEGLFQNIQKQILTDEQSLNNTLQSTNQRFIPTDSQS